MLDKQKLCWAFIGASGVSLSLFLYNYYQDYWSKQIIHKPKASDEISKADQVILYLKKYIKDL